MTSQPAPQPPACNCFRVPHAFYCRTVTQELVPGYLESADGLADAADQRKWDAHTASAIEKILGA